MDAPDWLDPQERGHWVQFITEEELLDLLAWIEGHEREELECLLGVEQFRILLERLAELEADAP